MKKVLSFLLTFTLILSMSINTFASINVTGEGDIASYLGTQSAAGSSSPVLTQTNGCYGKAINDKVISVSGFATNDYVYPIAGVEEVTENYYVIEFDYLIPTSGNSEIRFFTSDGNYIVGGIQAGNFFKEKWYKIVVYVDYTTSPNPTGYFFANGSQIKTYTATTMTSEVGKKNAAGDAVNSFKMTFVNVSSTNEIAKIDNFKAYGTNTKPDAVKMTKYNAPTGGSLSISGTTATAQAGVTVNSLKEAYPGYDFVAFADNSCTADISATKALTTGNALAITDPEGSIEIYSLTVEGEILENDDIIMTDGNLSAAGLGVKSYTSSWAAPVVEEQAAGCSGKAANDKILNITLKSEYSKIYPVNGLYELQKDYYVIEFDYLKKTANDVYIRLGANDESQVASEVSPNNFTVGKWHKVVIYIDYKTSPNPTAYLYVNGTQMGVYNSKELAKAIGQVNASGMVNGFGLYFRNVGGGAEIGIDNFKAYESDTAPDAAKMTRFDAPTEGTLSISGTIATAQAGVTVSSLKEAYPGYDFVAFADNSLTAEISAATTLTTGNALAITDPEGSIEIYSLTVEGEILENDDIIMTDGDLAAAGLGVAKYPVSSWVAPVAVQADGCNGKDASDKILNITLNSNYSKIYPVNGLYELQKDYYVIEFDYLKKTANDVYIRLGANDESQVASEVSPNNFVVGQWHKVVIYIDYTTTPNPTAYLYVNGEQAGDYDSKALASTIGQVNANGTVNGFGLYFRDGGAGISGVEIGIDNFKAYESDTAPDAAKMTRFDAPTEGSLSINGTTAMLKNITGTVAELKAEYTGYDFRAFTDESMTTQIDDNASIAAGNALVVTDPDGPMKNIYKVSVLNTTAEAGTATASLTNAAAGTVMFVAEYTPNRMLVDVTLTEAVNDGETLAPADNSYTDGNSIKVFIFDSIKDLRPVIAATIVR